MTFPRPKHTRWAQGSAPWRAAVSAVALIGLALPASANAASQPAAAFALEPVTAAGHASYFVLTGRPGQQLSVRLRVVNVGTRAGTVLLYPVDATTGQTSGAVYLGKDAPRRDVGAWTHVAESRIRLGSHQSRIVRVTIAIPARSAGGQHLGGLVAENAALRHAAPAKHDKGSFHINIKALTIAAVQVNLPGVLHAQLVPDSARAGGAGGYQAILIGIRNDGNALTKGSGTIAIRDSGGQLVKTGHFALDTFVPRTEVRYPVAVRGRALKSGHYTARVTLHSRGRTITRTFPFNVSASNLQQVFGSRAPNSPESQRALWPLVAGALAVLIAGFALAATYFRRRERELRARLGTHPPEPAGSRPK